MVYLTAAVPIILEVLLIVHVFRTGRDRYWIYIIFFVPLAGGVAYLLIEVLPDMIRGRGAATIKDGIARVVVPDKKIRDCEAQLALAPTVQNRSALADAWVEAGDPARAVPLFQQCLAGVYRDDRTIMGQLAHALHASGNDAGACRVFEEIVRLHGPLASAHHMLGYAAALDGSGEAGKAETAYREAAAKSPGLEARYRLATFLARAGRATEAEHQVRTMEQAFDLMPRFARRDQRAWMVAARRELDA